MKTLKLSVLDRLLLPQLLPQQGGKYEMKIANSIATKVDLTKQELLDFELKDNNGRIFWNPEKAVDVDFEFPAIEVEMLKTASKQADENRTISPQNLALIEKIDNL